MRRSSSGGGVGQLLRRGIPAVLVAVAAYYAIWGGEYSVFDIGTLRERQTTAQAELIEMQRTVDSLRVAEELLQDDRATIEAVARERFGMVRKGELLYRFVEVDTASRP